MKCIWKNWLIQFSKVLKSYNDKNKIMKTNIWLISTMVLLIILFGTLKTCNDSAKDHESQLKALTDDVEYFKNKLGTETASKSVLQISNRNLKNIILKKDDSLNALMEEFKKVKSIVRIKTEFKVDTVKIPFEVKIPCEFSKIGQYKTANFNFDYEIDPSGFNLENINVPNEITVLTGFKRKWIFGRQQMKTDVFNSNPLIKTTNIETIETRIPRPFYDTRVFNLGVGFIGGILLSK